MHRPSQMSTVLTEKPNSQRSCGRWPSKAELLHCKGWSLPILPLSLIVATGISSRKEPSVDHVDVKVNKIDAIVDGAGRGDVLNTGPGVETY